MFTTTTSVWTAQLHVQQRFMGSMNIFIKHFLLYMGLEQNWYWHKHAHLSQWHSTLTHSPLTQLVLGMSQLPGSIYLGMISCTIIIGLMADIMFFKLRIASYNYIAMYQAFYFDDYWTHAFPQMDISFFSQTHNHLRTSSGKPIHD